MTEQQKIKVLIAENNKTDRYLLNQQLGGNDRLDVLLCSTLEESLKRIESENPGVVIFDFNLSSIRKKNEDGIQIAKFLITREPGPVMVSNSLSPKEALGGKLSKEIDFDLNKDYYDIPHPDGEETISLADLVVFLFERNRQ